jgi:DNA repair protein RadC
MAKRSAKPGAGGPPPPAFPFAPAVPPRITARVAPPAPLPEALEEGPPGAVEEAFAEAVSPASRARNRAPRRPTRDPSWLRSARAERLREQLLVFGPEALADDELIELLLGAVIPPETRDEAVAGLFSRFPTAAAALSAPTAALEGIPGITREVVAQFRAMRALAVRLAGARMVGRPLVRSRAQLIRVAAIAFGHLHSEAYCAIHTDKATRMITYDVVRAGTVNRVPLYPREVVARALQVGAVGLILIHNHPSGDPKPSEADIALTQAIARAGAVLGIELHDHLIVAGGAHISMRDLGLV